MIKTIQYDIEKYSFKYLFENCLGELELIHKNFQLKEITDVLAGGIETPEENTYQFLIEKLFKEVIHTEKFDKVWNTFCMDIIKPFFNENKVVIQKLPSIKIFVSGQNWRFVEPVKKKNNRYVNLHTETNYPYCHPCFETNFIVPLIDMDEDNGLFVDDIFCTPSHGEVLIFDQVEHGGYVKNVSKNTRVSIDFKGCAYTQYNFELLSENIFAKKRGKWIKQTELFTIGNYYRMI